MGNENRNLKKGRHYNGYKKEKGQTIMYKTLHKRTSQIIQPSHNVPIQ